MTWIKKISSEWQPNEFPNLPVGGVIEWGGNMETLLREGNIALCDENGNEVSTFEKTGMITEREKKEFEAYVELKRQERLKASMEKEKEELLAEAKILKAEHAERTEVQPKREKTEEEKRAFAEKMTAARIAARQKREQGAKK